VFVAVSIGTAIFNEDRRIGLAAFLTPTVMHFAAVLFACLVATMPSHTWYTLGGMLGTGALAGAIYSGRLVVQMIAIRSFKIDMEDRLFYGLLPLAGYGLALAAAVLLLTRAGAIGTDLLAAAALTLLFGAIRNAWDMMVWIVIKTPTR
jgi:hypothetical protein